MRRIALTLSVVLALAAIAIDAQQRGLSFGRGQERSGQGGSGGGGGEEPSSVVFFDQFTVASDTNLASKTPNTGTGWTEVIDTQGSRTILADDVTLAAQVSSSANNHRIIYTATPSPALSGQDYDISGDIATLTGGGSLANRPGLLIFGYVDTNNYCGVAVYNDSTTTDLAVFKVVAGTASDVTGGTLTTANLTAGDTVVVEARGSTFTIFDGTTELVNVTDGDCDGANGVGIGFGNARLAGDLLGGNNFRWDNVTVTQAGGTQAGIPPSITITTPTDQSTYSTDQANVTIGGAAVAGSAALASVTVSCTGATTITNQAATGTTTWSTSLALNTGTTTCTATVTDAAPLTAQSTSLAITRSAAGDTTRPTISWTFPASSPYAAGQNENPITATFNGNDNVAVTSATWSNDEGGSGTCTISGPVTTSRPVSCGPISLADQNVTNTITITLSDAAGNLANASTTRDVTYIADLQIITSTLPGANQNVAYGNRQLIAGGGVSPYTWTVQGAASLNAVGGACTGGALSSGGVVSGTFTTTGTCNFTAVVTDSQGSPDTDTQALSIVVSASGTEQTNDYFDEQISRSACASGSGGDGTNCVIQIIGCSGANGACHLRSDAQVASVVESSNRSAVSLFYCFDGVACTDDNPDGAVDGAREKLTTTNGGGSNVFFRIPPQGSPTSLYDGSITLIWDEWISKEYMQNDCPGGMLPNGFNRKMNEAAGTDAQGKSGNFFLRWSKAGFNNLYPGTTDCDQRIGYLSNPGNREFTPSIVDAELFGVDGGVGCGDGCTQQPGNGTVWTGDNTQADYPIKVTTWTRHIYHLELGGIPGNSSHFNSWRNLSIGGCDPNPAGQTQNDVKCASMLTLLGDADPDCAVEDAANCDLTYGSFSYWVCDETRGCARVVYRTPMRDGNLKYWNWQFHGADDDPKPDSTLCNGCTANRYAYFKNFMMIRNIDSADIDDSGCPLSCTGDTGAVNSNVFRKPKR